MIYFFGRKLSVLIQEDQPVGGIYHAVHLDNAIAGDTRATRHGASSLMASIDTPGEKPGLWVVSKKLPDSLLRKHSLKQRVLNPSSGCCPPGW